MTHLEAKDKLKHRVEWRVPLGSALVFPNSESGRYIQEEHPAIKLDILRMLIVNENATDEQFVNRLTQLKEDAIFKMLHDVFSECLEIPSDFIDDFINLYDYAIILRTTRSVLFEIINSPRINELETVLKQRVNQWFLDLNGVKNKEDGIFVEGYISRYEREIKRIQKVIGKSKNRSYIVTAR